MKRHLIWIVTGVSALVLAVPAFAAVQSDGSPDDDGVPGDVRGNCDEAEHANDPECVTVDAPASTVGTIAVTTPITTPSTTPATVSSTVPTSSTPVNTNLAGTVPENTVASNSVPGGTVAGAALPNGSVPTSSTVTSLPGDISGPCDEAEHADDPRCTGATVDTEDNSGPGSNHDGQDDGQGDDHGDDDSDHSGPGHGGDDGGSDDNSGHGSDD